MEVVTDSAGTVRGGIQPRSSSADRDAAINLLALVLLSPEAPFFMELDPRHFAHGIAEVAARAFRKKEVPKEWRPAVEFIRELPAHRIAQLRVMADTRRRDPKAAAGLRALLPDGGASSDGFGSPQMASDFAYTGVIAHAAGTNERELRYGLAVIPELQAQAGHAVTVEPPQFIVDRSQFQPADPGPPVISPDGTITTDFGGSGRICLEVRQRVYFDFGVAGKSRIQAGFGLVDADPPAANPAGSEMEASHGSA